MGIKLKKTMDQFNQRKQCTLSANHEPLQSLTQYSVMLYDKIPYSMIMNMFYMLG